MCAAQGGGASPRGEVQFMRSGSKQANPRFVAFFLMQGIDPTFGWEDKLFVFKKCMLHSLKISSTPIDQSLFFSAVIDPLMCIVILLSR